MPMTQTRRRFLTTVSLAGAAGFLGAPAVHAAEEALETTAIRLYKIANVCVGPQYVAEELLRAEGFTEIRYIDTPAGELSEAIGRGESISVSITRHLLSPRSMAATRSPCSLE